MIFSHVNGKGVDFRFSMLHNKHLLKKGSTLKEKNLLQGSKFFSFRVDPFLKGRNSILKELPLVKVYPFSFSKPWMFKIFSLFS